MPAILELSCSHCSYRTSTPTHLVFVLLDSGTASPCPHPGEITHAEAVTKRTFDELQKLGRIYSAAATFCRTCGELHYPRLTKTATSADRCTCPNCNTPSLEPFERNTESPGGCAVMGLWLNAALWPPVIYKDVRWHFLVSVYSSCLHVGGPSVQHKQQRGSPKSRVLVAINPVFISPGSASRELLWI